MMAVCRKIIYGSILEEATANLTVHNLDDRVVEQIKSKARENNRSLEAKFRESLAAAARSITLVEFRAEARRISVMTPDVPQTGSTELILEDRDR